MLEIYGNSCFYHVLLLCHLGRKYLFTYLLQIILQMQSYSFFFVFKITLVNSIFQKCQNYSYDRFRITLHFCVIFELQPFTRFELSQSCVLNSRHLSLYNTQWLKTMHLGLKILISFHWWKESVELLILSLVLSLYSAVRDFAPVLLVYFCQNRQLHAKKKVSVKKWQISPKFLHKKAPRYVNSRWLLTNLVILTQQQLFSSGSSFLQNTSAELFETCLMSNFGTFGRCCLLMLFWKQKKTITLHL